MAKSLSSNLRKAKAGKNDEFYTQLTDIEKELKHYKEYFNGKTIYCNCDDPEWSNFFRYFALNFDHLKLKKLITTHFVYSDLFVEGETYKLELTRGLDLNEDGRINLSDIVKTKLKGNGDFRSEECIELLEQADIVVTNPPFSLFREYVAQLIDFDKKFIIIGHQNAITYKEIFKLIKEDKIWLGVDNGGTKWFKVQDHYEIETESRIKIINGEKYFSMGSVVWFTNMDTYKRHDEIILYKNYTAEEYPFYDNFNAINIDRVAEIPLDFNGLMGVPITFLDKYNPKQFEIIGQMATTKVDDFNFGYPYVNGKKIYARVLIKKK